MSQGESCPFQRCVDKKRTGCYSTGERIRENLGQSELGRTVAQCDKYERENYYILGQSHPVPQNVSVSPRS